MDRSEKTTLMNMCMIYDAFGNVLVQERKKEDYQGITFPGGHIEQGESIVESVIREVHEETGLTIKHPMFCGVKQWFDKERYIVFLYKANRFAGKLNASDEGDVFWIPEKDLASYELALDMMEMLPLFKQDDVSEFFYYEEDGEWKHKLL